MHSRIYQISLSQTPEEGWIDEGWYGDDAYMMGHMDYVTETNDDERAENINWLMSGFANIEREGDMPKGCITLDNDCLVVIQKPLAFAEASLQKIRELSQRLTIEDLAQRNKTLLDLRNELGQKDWWDTVMFHDVDENRVMTWKEFLWETCNVPEGTRFYLGPIMDYHF